MPLKVCAPPVSAGMVMLNETEEKRPLAAVVVSITENTLRIEFGTCVGKLSNVSVSCVVPAATPVNDPSEIYMLTMKPLTVTGLLYQENQAATPPTGPTASEMVMLIDSPWARAPLGPDGPEGPVGPDAPVGPDGPPGPLGPEGPVGPLAPDGPLGPDGPDTRLVAPLGPDGPLGPIAGPDGPVGPLAPEGPSSAYV